MRQKKIKKKLFIFLLLACIAALAFAVYAAFPPTTQSEKRVAVARTKDVTDSNALRFSSNYLSPYDKGTDTYGNYPISVSSSGDVTIGVTVCNYPQDNPTLTNDTDITYTISMKVLDSNFEEISGTGVTITDPKEVTLTGKQRSSQIHIITIPKNAIEQVSQGYLQVVATPSNGSDKKLAANLQIVPASVAETAWTGISGDSNVDFTTLDAYNYQISGTEKCTLTLSWNKNLVALSDWSIQTLNKSAETDSVKKAGTITFEVGGENQPTSYMLQFYRVSDTAPGSFTDLRISLTTTKQ